MTWRHIMMSSGKQTLCALCFFFVCFGDVMANIPTYYLDDYCGLTLDMNLARVKSGRIMLRRPDQSITYKECPMTIKAPSNKRLTFKFHNFDIKSPYGCHNNNFQIFDDDRLQLSMTDKLCNTNLVPSKAYVTTGEVASVMLDKENYMGDQVELIFTAFNFSPCLSGDYQCDNSHCIASELYCNGFDNCGDESDICLLRQGTVIGLVIALVVVVVILAIFFIIYMIRRRQKIRREKKAGIYSGLVTIDPYTGEKTMTYVTKSSRDGSLLSRRDKQMSGGYFVEPSGRILQLQPSLLLDDSDWTGKSVDGQGHRNDSFVYSDGVHRKSSARRFTSSGLAVEGGHSMPRSKSVGELRPPFFFDRDGSVSDSSASQRLGYDQPDLYTVPKKKGKKNKRYFGSEGSNIGYVNTTRSSTISRSKENKASRKDKKSKRKKSKATHGGLEINERDHGMIEHRDDSIKSFGHEEMTDMKYIDGSPLVNGTPIIPDIYITPPLEQMKKEGVRDNPLFWNVDQNKSPVTSPNGILKELRKDANSASRHSSESERVAERLDNRGSFSAPGQRPVNVTNKNDTTFRRSISTNESLNHHNSTERKQSSHSPRIEVMSPTGNLAGSGRGDRSSQRLMTNVDLPQLLLTVDEDSTSMRRDSGHIMQSPPPAPMTPTRQMGLEARHPDGSPFILHTAEQVDVERQLQEHPDERPDVQDHVISFRTYPSPVHRADPFLFQRRESRYRSGSMYSPTTLERLYAQRRRSSVARKSTVDENQIKRSHPK